MPATGIKVGEIMNFWRVGLLSKLLKENTVPEKDKMRYLIAFCLINATGVAFHSWVPLSYRLLISHLLGYVKGLIKTAHVISFVTILDYLFAAAPLIITVVGIYLCYRANKSGDNKNFIERFVCLSVPITKQVILYTIAACCLVGTIAYLFFYQSTIAFLDSLAPVIKGPEAPTNPVGLIVGIVKLIPEAVHISRKVKTHIGYIINIFCYGYLMFSFVSLITMTWLYARLRSNIKRIAN